jgi:hypothetical protein
MKKTGKFLLTVGAVAVAMAWSGGAWATATGGTSTGSSVSSSNVSQQDAYGNLASGNNAQAGTVTNGGATYSQNNTAVGTNARAGGSNDTGTNGNTAVGSGAAAAQGYSTAVERLRADRCRRGRGPSAGRRIGFARAFKFHDHPAYWQASVGFNGNSGTAAVKIGGSIGW